MSHSFSLPGSEINPLLKSLTFWFIGLTVPWAHGLAFKQQWQVRLRTELALVLGPCSQLVAF